MKKTLSILFVTLALAIGLLGQSTNSNLVVTATKLAAAMSTTSQNSLRVSSATGITANTTVLYIIDGSSQNGEAVFVNSVNGTTIGVTRGYNGTQANTHLSGAPVLVGPAGGGPFVSVDPSGTCTAASSWTPTVNLLSGNQWICSTITATWVPGFFNRSAQAGVTTLVASVAGATNPTGPLFHISGTNAITAWGSSTSVGPGTGQAGGSSSQSIGANFCVIPDAAYTTVAGNNIGASTTAVAAQVQCWTWDATNKAYQPSYK